MAGFTDTYENGFLDLLLRGDNLSLIADDTATTPLTNLYHSLHTGDPTDTPGTNQTQLEIGYTSYGRATVGRATAYNVASGGSSSPAANIDFAAGTGGTGTATHFGIGSVISTAGSLICSGTVTPNIVTGDGVTPRLTTATTITLD